VTAPWDSHCHVWKEWPYTPAVPDAASRGTVEQLLCEMDAHGVEHALVVCAAIGDNPDNVRYADAARARYPDRLSLLADLDCVWHPTYHEPGAADRLRLVADRYPLAGVTHYVHAENDGWLVSEEGDAFLAAAGERGLLVSLSITPAWFGDLRAAALRHPEVPLLVHHLGQTAAAVDGSEPAGLDALLRCAEAPNVHVKVSGFYYHVQPLWEHGFDFPWPRALGVLRRLVEAFGVDRLLWGSDYPVSRWFCTYRQSIEVVRRYADFLDADAQARIFRANLERLLTARPAGGSVPFSVMYNDRLVRVEAERARRSASAGG
jgi:predicted TIM-barrel fold metal-dependent hydrolase